MLTIPTVDAVKQQAVKLAEQKELEEAQRREAYVTKVQRGIDNLIAACTAKADRGEQSFRYDSMRVSILRGNDTLPACVDAETLVDIARAFRKAGYSFYYDLTRFNLNDSIIVNYVSVSW